jgi:hypothetical protein
MRADKNSRAAAAFVGGNEGGGGITGGSGGGQGGGTGPDDKEYRKIVQDEIQSVHAVLNQRLDSLEQIICMAVGGESATRRAARVASIAVGAVEEEVRKAVAVGAVAGAEITHAAAASFAEACAATAEQSVTAYSCWCGEGKKTGGGQGAGGIACWRHKKKRGDDSDEDESEKEDIESDDEDKRNQAKKRKKKKKKKAAEALAAEALQEDSDEEEDASGAEEASEADEAAGYWRVGMLEAACRARHVEGEYYRRIWEIGVSAGAKRPRLLPALVDDWVAGCRWCPLPPLQSARPTADQVSAERNR